MPSDLSTHSDAATSLYLGRVYHSTERSVLLDWFRFEDRRVLDVGCGTGAYAQELSRNGVEVHGITLSDEESRRVPKQIKRTVVANVETWSPDYPPGYFDAVLLSHVLEHLVNPEAALRKLTSLLRPGGRVYVALPNIAFWRYRLRAVFGRFDYEESGPMDKSHLRFFTFRSAQSLLDQAGLDILRAEVRGHLPLGKLRRVAPKLCRKLDALAIRVFPGFFGYEIYLSASKSALA